MDASTISAGGLAVLHYGYLLMFVGMLIEGSFITAAGSFAAALGYFNLWIVLLLSVLGNLIPDVIYYAIGFWGRQKFMDKYGHYFRVTPERTEKLERLYREHAGKTLMIVKMVPLLATPGLIIAGAARVPAKKFAIWGLIVTVPSSFSYLLIGYYFGAAYEKIIRYMNYGGYFIVASIAIFITLSYLQKRYGKKLGEKITS
jgi:membrane protein DedA with SNARE-associated domain